MAEAKQISLLEQTVVDVINKSVSSIEKGAEFLAGQLPDIAGQYLRWMFAYYSIWLIFSVVLLYVVAFPFRKYMLGKAKKEREEHFKKYGHGEYLDLDHIYIPLFLGSVVVGVPCTARALFSVFEMAKIYIAPKVYLIEWAKSFL